MLTITGSAFRIFLACWCVGWPWGQCSQVDVAQNPAPVYDMVNSYDPNPVASPIDAASAAVYSPLPLPAVPDVGALEIRAAAALQDALASKQAAERLVAHMNVTAFRIGGENAQQQIQGLEASKIAQAEAAAATTPEPQVQAAQNMAAEHLAEASKAMTMAKDCNDIAANATMEAQALTKQAVDLATLASEEQAKGNTQQAQQDMTKAHETLHVAITRKAGALKFRKFAEGVNSLVPVYQQAAYAATNGGSV